MASPLGFYGAGDVLVAPLVNMWCCEFEECNRESRKSLSWVNVSVEVEEDRASQPQTPLRCHNGGVKVSTKGLHSHHFLCIFHDLCKSTELGILFAPDLCFIHSKKSMKILSLKFEHFRVLEVHPSSLCRQLMRYLNQLFFYCTQSSFQLLYSYVFQASFS